MNFELTITGLCVTVLKANVTKPERPTSIDIIIPKAHHHAARLTYLPGVVPHEKYVHPKLVINELGGRIASLDINQALELSFTDNPNSKFSAHWGSGGETPSAPWQETWLDWHPRLEELGFEPFVVGPAGTLPDGALARLTLPPGRLAARNIIKKPYENQCLRWKFPAVNVTKALANELVYTMYGSNEMAIKDRTGNVLLSCSEQGTRPVRMCITHDMEYVPYQYGDSSAVLEHLKHIESVAGGTFQKPQEVDNEHTGHPICMSVIFVAPEW